MYIDFNQLLYNKLNTKPCTTVNLINEECKWGGYD